MPGWPLRPEMAADEKFVTRLVAVVKAGELEPYDFEEAMLRSLLDLQARSYHAAMESAFPGAERLIVTTPQGKPFGRMVIMRRPNRFDLAEIMLLPEFREQGIGTALLRGLLALAALEECQVRTLVIPRGPAWRFFRRLGFTEIAMEGRRCLMEAQP